MSLKDHLFRFGKISKVYYEDGMVDVVYHDRTDAVSEKIRVLLNEYSMPDVDDPVFVMHMPNGRTEGLCFGRYWYKDWKPEEGFKGLFRKAFSRKQDQCYIKYTDPDEDDGNGNDGTLLLHNEDDTRAESKNFEREAEENITDKSKGHKIDVDGDAEITATGKVTISGASEIVVKSSANITIQAGGQLHLTGAGGTINVSGNGAFAVNGVSLPLHTHNCTAPGAPSGPPIPLSPG